VTPHCIKIHITLELPVHNNETQMSLNHTQKMINLALLVNSYALAICDWSQCGR